MDFNGADNRYGQTAVPDFIDYLCVQSHQLRDLIELSYTTRLQCSICGWVKFSTTSDISLKLYLPPDSKRISLDELIVFTQKQFYFNQMLFYVDIAILKLHIFLHAIITRIYL